MQKLNRCPLKECLLVTAIVHCRIEALGGVFLVNVASGVFRIQLRILLVLRMMKWSGVNFLLVLFPIEIDGLV